MTTKVPTMPRPLDRKTLFFGLAVALAAVLLAMPVSAANVTFPNDPDPVIGTLPAMSEVTIEFQVDVENPLAMAAGQICNQATVSGTGFADVDSDDPTVAGAANPTCTILQPFDLGDAADPTFPTLVASVGPRHAINPGIFLGACVDSDADGQPNATATGDDVGVAAGVTEGVCAVANDDEDGVAFSALVPGVGAMIDVTASTAGLLDAWVDWDANGDWNGVGEQIFDDEALGAGVNSLAGRGTGGCLGGESGDGPLSLLDRRRRQLHRRRVGR